MLLILLLLIPIIGIISIATTMYSVDTVSYSRQIKVTGLFTCLSNLFISLIVFIFFNFSSNQFQFVQEYHKVSSFDFYLGVDGISIYFVILTTIIMPIALLSNWSSISENVKSYVIIILLLETLLLAAFLVLDVLLFYIFFESILPPLFILIGLFGSSNRVRASFYLFLYTFNLKCKRAKFRGNPKALVTKVIEEILLLAWLMSQGMVISLVFSYEKHLKFSDVDTWAIADLNHLKYIIRSALNKPSLSRWLYKGVKEQRVDGSPNSSYTGDFVRCTLVAGKPVLGRKIHFHSDKTKFSNLALKRCIHSNKSVTCSDLSGKPSLKLEDKGQNRRGEILPFG